MSHHYSYSGDRFTVVYDITGNEAVAQTKAEGICIEQTIEFPADLVTSEEIKRHVIGQLKNLQKINEDLYQAEISFAVEVTGFEIIQLLNVLFGNTSIQTGIKVVSVNLPESLLKAFRGPRFGREGLRKLLNVSDRPLLCSALKPMGLSTEELANIVYDYALGGIDIIKDDHGFANQSFSPFEERVAKCSEAVFKANQITGKKSIYLPNIPGPTMDIFEKAEYAKQNGAGGLLVSPGLLGFDVLRALADNDDLRFPIMSHPAMLGSFTSSKNHGFSHYFLYGTLPRLAGADMVVFPVFGGRFSFSVDECQEIINGCSDDLGQLSPVLPVPAGGMRVDRVPEMIDFFGNDMVLLIGGNLQRGGTFVENCKRFLDLVIENSR